MFSMSGIASDRSFNMPIILSMVFVRILAPKRRSTSEMFEKMVLIIPNILSNFPLSGIFAFAISFATLANSPITLPIPPIRATKPPARISPAPTKANPPGNADTRLKIPVKNAAIPPLLPTNFVIAPIFCSNPLKSAFEICSATFVNSKMTNPISAMMPI